MTFTGGRTNRRTLILGLAGAMGLMVTVAACGDDSVESASTQPVTSVPVTDPSGTVAGTDPAGTDPAGASISHPTGASDVVLRISYEGGFVPVGFAFTNMPTLLVAGDGTVYTPGVTTMEYPGPLVSPMSVRTMDEDGVQSLLALAEAAGLLGEIPDYSAELNVADVPNTVVTIVADGVTYVHSAYALALGSDDSGTPNPEVTPARQALADFVAEAVDLQSVAGADHLGPESVLEPTAYRFQAYPAVDTSVGSEAEPVETVAPNDTVVGDEAAIEPDPAPAVVDWPAALGVSLADVVECASVDASAAGSLFTDARSNTLFRDGGAVYNLAVAAVLPGDAAC